MAFPGPFAFVPRPTAMQDGDFESGSVNSTSDMQVGLGQSVGTSFLPGLNPGQLHSVLVNDADGSTVAPASTGIARLAVDFDNPHGLPPLILAAKKGRLAEVELLLKDPALDINQIHQRSDCTALMAATCADKSDVVKCLLAAGAKVNLACGEKQRTALIQAAALGHVEVVKILLTRKDIALDSTDADGLGALYLAARNNAPDLVVCLLAAGAKVNSVGGQLRRTALIAAAYNGNIEVVKALLKCKDIVLDQTDAREESALLVAAENNMPNVVACLLAAGAKVNLKYDELQRTALMEAAIEGRIEIVKALLTRKDIALDEIDANGQSALFMAANRNEPEVVACLLAAGAKVNLKYGELQRTALMEAAIRGHIEVVKALLTRKDIALDEIDANRHSALYIAANQDKPEVVVYLLAARANVNLGCGEQRRTALMNAALGGHIEVLKTLLISKDIALDETDANGHGALFIAALLNKPDVVECLLAAEAKVNLVCDQQRTTALIQAASWGHFEVVKTLLKCKDITVDKTDANGFSALYTAANKNKPDVVACLLAAGAKVNLACGEQRCTPLMTASLNGYVAIVKMLLAHKDIARNKTDVNERSALFWAAVDNKPEAVACLLEARASMTIADESGDTATTIAILKKHAAVLEVLIQHSAAMPGFQPVDLAQPPSDIAFAVTLADLDADRNSEADAQYKLLGPIVLQSLDDSLAVIDQLLASLETKQDLQQWLRAKGIRIACALPVVECLASLASTWPVLTNGSRAATVVQKRLVCAAALGRLAVLTADGRAFAHYTAAGISAAGITRLSAVATRQIDKLIAISEQTLTTMGKTNVENLIPVCLVRTSLARQVDAENLVADLVSAGWLMPLAQAVVTSWKSTLAALEAGPLAIATGLTMQQINQRVFESTELEAPQIFAQAMQRELAGQTLVAALRTWIGNAKSVEGLDLLFQIQCNHLRQYCEQTGRAD